MKNHIAFKFLAIALCALALLSSVASGAGIVALTAAGLYDKTVNQVREESIKSIGKGMAHDVALHYASMELGGCPESVLYRRYGSSAYEFNFLSEGYGYTLKDGEGNTLETGGYLTPDSKESFSTYTFPVTGQYLYLVSSAPEVVPEATESELLEEPRRAFDRRRRAVHALLQGIPGVKSPLPESAYLTWADVSALGTAEEVAACLMREAKVCVNAGTPYGKMGAGHIRIVHGCFLDEARICRAMERVRAALLQLSREKGLAEKTEEA